MAQGRVIDLEDLSACLGDFKVVNKLCLDIARNELRCISPNGAWKSAYYRGKV
ncbi:hypothetical protein [Polaromonas sp.]|uniref:hypothetical protein n=1 Tax=Polaromonas sp. TaxID=1869339 RepID=UPI0017FF6426|nr:hypothetical protein [Polaromonas sp.]NML87398.1 hypothetical protein [Polaromonas sp.]